ncbi:RAD50 DNA repair-like protein [Trypanosoma vivax]|nr:RAD50 DNA repair-like protein [Trypanosoma vivax]
MTSIEQIEISGVRSFDPDPNHRQRIIFKKPLTVIVGKNGAGKTTIIEALLNACTGQMPPGSGIEKSSFVYDPKVMGETDVKAQIRLLFTGRGGKLIQVIRSFQAVRSRNKTTFSTLDNIVAFEDAATQKVVSSAYRANDVDRAIPDMLGVSAAVLEHVIFCHQEDGNWPLSPPKDVKKIFDEIFAATRYVLALDRLRENSKELRRQQKEHEASFMALSEHLVQAQQLQNDINTKENSIQVIRDKFKAMEPEQSQLRAVVQALTAVQRDAEDLSREAAMIQGQIHEKNQSLDRLNIGAVDETLEELVQRRNRCGERVQTLKKEVQSAATLLEEAEADARRYDRSVFHLRSTIGVFEQQAQEHKQCCLELQDIVKKLSLDVSVEWDQLDEQSLTCASACIDRELRKETEELDAATKLIEEKVASLEERQRALFRSMDSDNREKEMKQEQLSRLEQRLSEAERTLFELRPHAKPAQLQALQVTIKELEDRVEASEVLRKSGDDYKQRQEIQQCIAAQNNLVVELRQELARRRRHSNLEAEMNLLRGQIATKQENLESGLRDMLIAGLMEFDCGTEADMSLSCATLKVEHLRQKKADAIRAVRADRSALERQIMTLEQKRSQLLEDIMKESTELERKRVRCVEVLGDLEQLDNFEGVLASAREVLRSVSQQSSARHAMTACYSHLVEMANASGKCPLCDRSFESEEERSNFLRLYEKQQSTSAQESPDSEVLSATQRVRCLEELEADVHSVRRLTASVPQLEHQARLSVEELEGKRALVENIAVGERELEEQLGRVEGLAQVAAELNTVASEIKSLQYQLSRRETYSQENQGSPAVGGSGSVPADGGGSGSVCDIREKTYEEISTAYEAANAEFCRLNVLLSEAQRRGDGLTDHALDSELSKKRSELCELQMKLTRQAELEKTIADCRKEAADYVERIGIIDKQREQFQADVDGGGRELQTLQERREELHRAAHDGRLGQLKAALLALSNLVPKLRSYITSQQGDKLLEAREKLRTEEELRTVAEDTLKNTRSTMQEKQQAIEEELRCVTEVEKLIEFVERQESLREDEKRLQQVQESLTELKLRRVQGVEQILGRDVVQQASVARLHELIRDKIGALERTRAQQEGLMEAMLQDVSNLKSQLSRDKYKDIEKRYRTTFIKVQTTEVAVADVEKYYRALEKAVQTYHQEKIAQINEILAGLWRLTYKGSDIDTIELRSEDDATSTTVRRSYSYRVVMKRGNSEMDMRGRCSAGQKVLASVLIRLALSEAFCCDCGILALDEPTTNLDEDNARSLAESLRQLIVNRRSVKHFQLIIITHDEHFVRALGGQALDTYYFVRKDREGAFSVIEERTFNQLFAS